jgi:hypothetical protein
MICAGLAVLSVAGFRLSSDDDTKGRATPYAEIRVIDVETGRGVPLVELVTVNHLRFVTDNAGRVAFHEPGLMDREVFFTVRSHGYEMKKDGFGFSGVRIIPKRCRSWRPRLAHHRATRRWPVCRG